MRTTASAIRENTPATKTALPCVQKIGSVLCVYRVATRRDLDHDPCPEFGYQLRRWRDFGHNSDAAGSGCNFGLVFEMGPEERLDQIGLSTIRMVRDRPPITQLLYSMQL